MGRSTVRLVIFSLMMVVAVPAYTAEVVQMWSCELDDDASEEAVVAGAEAWIAAARQVPGGENFKASVLFPIAVNATGPMDVWFIVSAPSAEEWGRFWDNYQGSAAAEQEVTNEALVVCPDSVLWESIKVGGE